MAKLATGSCAKCGDDFSRPYHTRRPIKCAPCADKERGRITRRCVGCGNTVGSRRHKCDACNSDHTRSRSKSKRARRAEKLRCTGCGEVFRRGRRKIATCFSCVPASAIRYSDRENAARRAKNADRVAERAAAKALGSWKDEVRAQRAADREADRASKPWLAPGLALKDARRLRYRHDPVFNVAERVRIQLRNRRRFRNFEYTIRKAVAGKVTTPSIERFLGYTMRDLRDHLEAQFTDGMTWAAFAAGAIHIDHRRPVSKFDLDDEAQVRECWALSNLQPLWAGDNMRKGCRVDGEAFKESGESRASKGERRIGDRTGPASRFEPAARRAA